MNEQLEPIIDALRDDVQLANMLSRQKEHAGVQAIFYKWINIEEQRLNVPPTLSTREDLSFKHISSKVDKEIHRHERGSFGYFTFIAVGILGLARILHVDNNSILKDSTNRTENTFEQVTAASKVIYENLKVGMYVPLTIDNHAIEWELETTQDEGRTYELLGFPNLANERFRQAIEFAETALENRGDAKFYAGIRSALAVLQLRIGRSEDDQSLIRKALFNQIRSNWRQLNPQRTKVLGGMAVKSATTQWRDAAGWKIQPLSRIVNLGLGTAMYLKHRNE